MRQEPKTMNISDIEKLAEENRLCLQQLADAEDFIEEQAETIKKLKTSIPKAKKPLSKRN